MSVVLSVLGALFIIWFVLSTITKFSILKRYPMWEYNELFPTSKLRSALRELFMSPEHERPQIHARFMREVDQAKKSKA